jgi:hypothetical protein
VAAFATTARIPNVLAFAKDLGLAATSADGSLATDPAAAVVMKSAATGSAEEGGAVKRGGLGIAALGRIQGTGGTKASLEGGVAAADSSQQEWEKVLREQAMEQWEGLGRMAGERVGQALETLTG